MLSFANVAAAVAAVVRFSSFVAGTSPAAAKAVWRKLAVTPPPEPAVPAIIAPVAIPSPRAAKVAMLQLSITWVIAVAAPVLVTKLVPVIIAVPLKLVSATNRWYSVIWDWNS